VWIDDWEIAPAHWATTRPRAGRRVTVRAIPTGGGGGDRNKTLRLVLMVVVLIIAAVVTWGVGAALAGTAFAAYGGVAGALAGGIVSAAGMMAVNALLPPPKPRMRDTTSSATSPTYSLTGTRNQLAPYQPVPRVYGRHRLFPPLAAYPVTWGSGNTNSLSQLFTCGYGPLVIEDIRIGETPIGHYEQVTLEVRGGGTETSRSRPTPSRSTRSRSASTSHRPRATRSTRPRARRAPMPTRSASRSSTRAG
jgi:hypothetical protein